MAAHQGRRNRQFTIMLVYLQQGVTASDIIHIVYVCTLYLRCKDTILVILCTNLPITTTIAGQWLNILIFHDDIKCITANGQMIIYVDAD